MGSVGSMSTQYVRFGEIPKNEQSINYTKLTLDQRRDITEAVENGENPIDAMKFYIENFRDWRNVNINDVVEKGVSVFKADTNGMPKIENITQAMSFATRIDKDLYSITGTRIGTGQDNEPLLQNTSSKILKINPDKLVNHLIDVMRKNFNNVSGKKNLADGDSIYRFHDSKTNEDYFVFKGLEFRKPKSKKWS